jgi:hypothetical protein
VRIDIDNWCHDRVAIDIGWRDMERYLCSFPWRIHDPVLLLRLRSFEERSQMSGSEEVTRARSGVRTEDELSSKADLEVEGRG